MHIARARKRMLAKAIKPNYLLTNTSHSGETAFHGTICAVGHNLLFSHSICVGSYWWVSSCRYCCYYHLCKSTQPAAATTTMSQMHIGRHKQTNFSYAMKCATVAASYATGNDRQRPSTSCAQQQQNSLYFMNNWKNMQTFLSHYSWAHWATSSHTHTHSCWRAVVLFSV